MINVSSFCHGFAFEFRARYVFKLRTEMSYRKNSCQFHSELSSNLRLVRWLESELAPHPNPPHPTPGLFTPRRAPLHLILSLFLLLASPCAAPCYGKIGRNTNIATVFLTLCLSLLAKAYRLSVAILAARRQLKADS